MATISTSVIAKSLKLTLDEIVDDDNDGLEGSVQFTKFMEVKSMSDAYEDDLEMGGPGFATEKDEGVELDVGGIDEGPITRYLARKFGLKLHVTEEALEDGKYERVINAAKRLKRAAWKTCDVDGANVLNRAFNTSYLGGDGVALVSASHTLPSGGTYSNTLATPFSPSRAALIVATTQARQLPGHDGVTEGYEPKGILCPLGQWAAWDGIVDSDKVPESNNNEINVVKGLKLDVTPLKFWTASTTNWVVQTDCDNGLQWRWRRKMKGRTWVDNDAEIMKYSISYRSARGWSDPRCVIGSNA